MATTFVALVMKKLIEIRAYVRGVGDANRHPVAMIRTQLDGFLRVTQTEVLEAFGEKSPKKLTVALRRSIAVMARIHKGCDSYRTIADKAEVLIKRLDPIHRAQLEAAYRRNMRRKLEQRFQLLSGGKVLPDGVTIEQLDKMVDEIHLELIADTQTAMEEVDERPFNHPDLGRLSDKNLLALKRRLLERRVALKQVRKARPNVNTALLS